MFLNFILPRFFPGNPVDLILNGLPEMAPTNSLKATYENFNREFGLNHSIPVQFLLYVKNLVTKGSLGTSFSWYPRSVSSLIAARIPYTILLMLPAILVGWILGNGIGAITAYKKGVFDKVIFPFALFLTSLPVFAFSIILVYFFAFYLKWLPSGGAYSFQLTVQFSLKFIGSFLYHYILPFLSIVFFMTGGQAIGMRSMAIYELNADYVLYSKLMGIRESRIVRYVFRNAMLPQITGLALSLGMMVGGMLVTEIVFNYPGIGNLLFLAIRASDFPLISGCTLFIITGVIIMNFLIDVLYGFFDPRIKTSQQEGNY
jgi:peptide/nickel transport system permease protein